MSNILTPHKAQYTARDKRNNGTRNMRMFWSERESERERERVSVSVLFGSNNNT